MVLICDTIWQAGNHSALIDSLVSIMNRSPNSTICLACGFHAGRQCVRDFLLAAQEARLVPVNKDKWKEVHVDGTKQKWEWFSSEWFSHFL